jgi:hypothetical protein
MIWHPQVIVVLDPVLRGLNSLFSDPCSTSRSALREGEMGHDGFMGTLRATL